MKRYLAILVICLVCISLTGCDEAVATKNRSGIAVASVSVPTGADGLTIEQKNIRDRLLLDNKPGSMKHLYVISAYSGDVILYSTVKGKVTSSSKRLIPGTRPYSEYERGLTTLEAIQDDGTYGSSIEYLFWWDQRGVYHQHYVQGGQIVHISDQPIRAGKVILNLEEQSAK